MVRDRAPDLVFLDLNIPGMSRRRGAARVEGRPGHGERAGDRRDRDGRGGAGGAVALGADDYFTKPFSPLALLRTVERVLEVPASPEA